MHRAKTRAGEAEGCVTPLGAFACDKLARLEPSRQVAAPESVPGKLGPAKPGPGKPAPGTAASKRRMEHVRA